MPYGIFREGILQICAFGPKRSKFACAVSHGLLIWLVFLPISSGSALQVMSPSSACAEKVPLMNGGGQGDPSEGRPEEETAATSSGLGAELRPEPSQTMMASGGGKGGGGDAPMGVEALPSAMTSAGHGDFQNGEIQQPTEQDPLLFQGSRSRANIADQVGASRDGPAEQEGTRPGIVAQATMDESVLQGGYQTPRARSSRPTMFVEATRQQQSSSLPTWVTRLGEFFRQPAVTWLPSPLPSPPLPRRSEDRTTGARLGERPSQVLEAPPGQGRSAGGVNRGQVNNPNSSTPSSSELPTEAIQAEVQRQLAGLLDRLQFMEAENSRLQEQLAATARDRNVQGSTEQRGDPAPQPQPRPNPWRDPIGALFEDWSQRRVPPMESLQEEPQPGDGVIGEDREQATTQDQTTLMLQALTKSMTQLQDMQVKSLQKTLDEDAPEAVKTSAPVLPALLLPEGISTGIILQDWLAQIAIAMQDLSPSSGTWWAKVMGVVQSTYTKWLGATPLERLQLQPQNYMSLAEGKWVRVNARACSMLLQSLAEPVKQDLIARRIVQHAVLILFRLHTMYQPGGASEKSLVLGNLQAPTACDTLEDTLAWLRQWPRWVQRCHDLGMMCPDGTVLAKALTLVTAKHIAEGGDAQFRTQLLRSTLRIDGQPTLDDVRRYQQHLQAELESVASSRTLPPAPLPRIKQVTAQDSPDRQGGGANAATATSKAPCKYFYKQSGCRRGQKCPYGHDLSTLPKGERAKQCLMCGAEDHRQRDCPTKTGKPQPKGQAAPQGQSTTSPTSSTRPKVQRCEPEGEASPTAGSSETVVSGEPIWTLESLLQAAATVATAKATPQSPSMNVVSVRAHHPMSGEAQAYALVDSGATHALRRARSPEEWEASSPVVVNLAGGGSVALRINTAGTILVPESTSTTSSSSAPIVPLGALVQQLGYSMTWSGSRCRLEGRNGEVLNMRVRDGCPEIAEHDALRLIAKLEDSQLEELKIRTNNTRRQVKAAAMMMERTWFDHLQSYVRSSIATEALKSIEAAPFLHDVPRPCLEGLTEAAPELNGWEALKGLEHLNRRARKRLWSSDKWLVHLFAGERKRDEIYHLEGHGYTVLELDISRGRSQDILRPSVWKVLEFAARRGKIAAIIGGPPQGSFMISRYNIGGPRPLRTNEFPFGNWPRQSDADVYEVNRETKLVVRMLYLHALATAGKLAHNQDHTCPREVAFMLEHPRDPRGYLKFDDPLYPGVVSLWRTSLWMEYALEAGLNTYSFDMAALGRAYTRFTTCGTNLALSKLDGLRSRWYFDGPVPEKGPPGVWPTEFWEHLVVALRNWERALG